MEVVPQVRIELTAYRLQGECSASELQGLFVFTLKIDSVKILVRLAGIEPARPYGHQILSLRRLPIPPQSHYLYYTFS